MNSYKQWESRQYMYRYITGSGYPINEAIISNFEKQNCLHLPQEYKNFLLKFNGGKSEKQYFVYVLDRKPPQKPTFSILHLICFLPLTDQLKSGTLESAFSFTQQYPTLKDKYLLITVSSKNWCNLLIGIHKSNFGQIFVWDYLEQQALHQKTPLIVPLFDSWSTLMNRLMTIEEAKVYLNLLKQKNHPELSDFSLSINSTVSKNVPLTSEAIRAFEQRIGYTLPDDYKYFLETDNGIRTPKKRITFYDILQRHIDSVEMKFHVVNGAPPFCDLESFYQHFINYFNGVRHLLTIGSWEGGDSICLDLSMKKYGQIFLWCMITGRVMIYTAFPVQSQIIFTIFLPINFCFRIAHSLSSQHGVLNKGKDDNATVFISMEKQMEQKETSYLAHGFSSKP